jgi:hypothetical protein
MGAKRSTFAWGREEEWPLLNQFPLSLLNLNMSKEKETQQWFPYPGTFLVMLPSKAQQESASLPPLFVVGDPDDLLTQCLIARIQAFGETYPATILTFLIREAGNPVKIHVDMAAVPDVKAFVFQFGSNLKNKLEMWRLTQAQSSATSMAAQAAVARSSLVSASPSEPPSLAQGVKDPTKIAENVDHSLKKVATAAKSPESVKIESPKTPE